MKKYGIMLLALLVCGAVNAAQDTTLTQKEVRDPRVLETILEANATDAETRIAACEAGTSISNLTLPGRLKITGTISNTALTASLPVVTDADKVLSSRTITNDDVNANASIAATKIAGEAVVKTTVHTGDVNGVWNALAITAGAITNDDIDANASIALTKIAGTALNQSTIFTGDVSGVYGSLVINAGTVHASMLDATIITNVLAGGMVLPAVDYSAATNGNAANIASGNIDIARVTNAMATAGSTIGGNIPVAAITNALTTGGASIGGNIPIAALTNAAGGGLCIVTNLDLNGTTNIITFIGTVQRNQ
jgi:hypothetical protein